MTKIIKKVGAVVEGRLISLSMEIADTLRAMDKPNKDNSGEIIDKLGSHLFARTGKSYHEEIVDRLATGVLSGDW